MQKKGYQITPILPRLHCIIGFQNHVKHIRRLIPTGDGDIFVYIEIYCLLCCSCNMRGSGWHHSAQSRSKPEAALTGRAY